MAKPELSASITPSRSRNYALYGAMGIAMVGLGVFKRKRVSDGEEKDATISNNHYRDTIMRLEGLGNLFLHGEHRFVGGILPLKYHFEGEKFVLDTHASFDFKHRVMYLTNTAPLELMRNDETIRDIDIIDFSTDRRQKIRVNKELKRMRKLAKKARLPHPHIGVESAFFPDGRKRNGKLQLVTADEVDEQGKYYLAFDGHKVNINSQSLESWRVIFADGTCITMLNPYAQILRYRMRVPSDVKPKDKKSDSYRAQKELARQFLLAGYREGINYHEIHREWLIYIHKFLYQQNLLTKGKAKMIHVYWSTIGTAIAHGKGFLKPLSTWTTVFKG